LKFIYHNYTPKRDALEEYLNRAIFLFKTHTILKKHLSPLL